MDNAPVVLELISEIQNRYASGEGKENLAPFILSRLAVLIGGSCGFFAEIAEDGKTIAAAGVWKEGAPTSPFFNSDCAPLQLFADQVLAVGTYLVVEDRETLSSRLPGCSCLDSLLLLPVYCEGRLLNLIGLADARERSNASLIRLLSPLLRLCAIITSTYRETERRNAVERELRLRQRELEDSELRLRQVIDLVPHHIFAILPRDGGRLIFANKALAAVYGMPPEEAVGKTQRDITPVLQEEEHFLADDLEVIESGKEKFVPEEIYTDPFGNVHYLQTTKIPFKAAGTDEPAVLGICVDISERKRAEEERKRMEARIQHAQKLESLGLLAGGIAHDFNNILTGILGHASLALRDLPADSRARERVAAIDLAAKRAADLCQQMLAYSGRGKFVVQPMDLTLIVSEVLEMLSPSMLKKAAIQADLVHGLPAIEVDPTQVRQIIINLLTNALDALGEHRGKIEIRTGHRFCSRSFFLEPYLDQQLNDGDYVFLEVVDSGCGMDEVTKARIFDPFFTTKFTGRGLGLAAVLGIVRGHRGAIKIETTLGAGSRFTVYFPASSRPAKHEAIDELAAAVEAGDSGATILVVDDEETVRGLAKASLEEFGFAVLTAKDGLEAIRIFNTENERIAAILLDITMPGLSGYETYKELRKSGAEVPILLSSGYNEQDVTTSFGGERLAGFVKKPYRAHELVAKIEEALGR